MKTSTIFQYVLAALIALGFFTLLGLLIFKGIPDQNKDLINIVIGTLISSFTTIVSYFWGSSKGSAEKNDILKGLADGNKS